MVPLPYSKYERLEKIKWEGIVQKGVTWGQKFGGEGDKGVGRMFDG